MFRGISIFRCIAFMSITFTIGCTAQPPKHAEENAETKAQALILQADRGIDKHCKQRSVLRRHTLETGTNEFGGNYSTERWFIDRCGKEVPYIVSYTQKVFGDPQINIRVSPEHERIPEATYIENVAEQNGCTISGEIFARPSEKPGHRIYDVACKEGKMTFECGAFGSRQSCWRI